MRTYRWFACLGFALSIAALALAIGLTACSSTSERFDHRPDICKGLGKRGREC